MRKHAIQCSAAAVLFCMVTVAPAQRRITITGGPGSDDTVTPPPVPAVVAGEGGEISEERIRQIVREELARAGLVPPLVSGPVGVSPSPQIGGTGVVTSVVDRTNTVTTRTNLAGRVVTNSVARTTIVTNAGGVVTPSGAGVVQPGAVGTPPPGGSVGVISGGSAGVGVATPSGAGANRATATQPSRSSAPARPTTGR